MGDARPGLRDVAVVMGDAAGGDRRGRCVVDKAIFVRAGGRLASMTETPYDNEAILQQVLEDFPDLLAGAATTGKGGRLLLVRREMPVADSNGDGLLSLDHLFVDSTGKVPPLVTGHRSRRLPWRAACSPWCRVRPARGGTGGRSRPAASSNPSAEATSTTPSPKPTGSRSWKGLRS